MKPLLENFLSNYRKKITISHLKVGNLCDVGCGCDMNKGLLSWGVNNINYTGVDMEIEQPINEPHLKLIKHDIDKGSLPLKDSSYDNVTLLAVIEHVNNPEKLVANCKRILKEDGRIIITVPSKKAKKLLITLGKMNFIDKGLLAQHRRYYTKDSLRELLENIGFNDIKITPFQFGFNILGIARK